MNIITEALFKSAILYVSLGEELLLLEQKSLDQRFSGTVAVAK